MKLMKTFGVLLLAALAVFFGTEYFFGNSAALANGDAAAYYGERVKSLESELAALRTDGYVSAVAYQSRITALEEELAASRGDFTCEATGNTVTLTCYTGNAKSVSLPAEIDGKTLVAVGKEAFRNTAVESVVLPEGVRTIGWFAFSGCVGLKSITIPSGVTSIEYGAFDGCRSLTVICEKGSFAEKYAESYGFRTVQP